MIGHDDLEPLAHADHVLVLAAPLQHVAGGQSQLLPDQLLGLLHVAADVPAGHVHVDVAGQEAVLVADHRRPADQLDVGELGQRHLRPRGGLHQDPSQTVQVVAELARVAHVDRVALAALDGGGHVLAADGRHDHRLHVVDGEPVAGELVAPGLEVDEVAAGHALGEDAAGAGHLPHQALELAAQLLDLLEVRAEDLDPDRGADAGRQHVDAGLDRHGPGVGDAGDPELPVHLVDQLVPRDPVGPDRGGGSP